MAVNGGPERRDAVQVPASIDIYQVTPLTSLDDGVALFEPIPHLGEWVPDISFVVLPKPMAAGGH